MFVHYVVHVNRPFDDVEREMVEVVGRLPEVAPDVYRRGEELHARLRADSMPLAKAVRLRIGNPRRVENETSIPLRWEATGPAALFPRMDADVVVSRAGADATQIAFYGSYEPPLGALGRAIDRRVLHRVAELTVKRLLDTVISVLNREAERSFAPEGMSH